MMTEEDKMVWEKSKDTAVSLMKFILLFLMLLPCVVLITFSILLSLPDWSVITVACSGLILGYSIFLKCEKEKEGGWADKLVNFIANGLYYHEGLLRKIDFLGLFFWKTLVVFSDWVISGGITLLLFGSLLFLSFLGFSGLVKGYTLLSSLSSTDKVLVSNVLQRGVLSKGLFLYLLVFLIPFYLSVKILTKLPVRIYRWLNREPNFSSEYLTPKRVTIIED